MWTAAFAMLTIAVIGCGGGVGGGGQSVEVSLESELTDLGQMYDLHSKQVRRPPRKFEDLNEVTANPPTAAADGRVTVYWGTPVSSNNTTTILAHDANAGTAGGWVLAVDCKTVKKMTADEFNTAPKAKK